MTTTAKNEDSSTKEVASVANTTTDDIDIVSLVVDEVFDVSPQTIHRFEGLCS
ncbi:MAG: hypothetical protein VW230_05620 [Candidatus Poseidoniales archaeon]